MCAYYNPLIFYGPVDGDNDVFTVVAFSGCKRLTLDFVAEVRQLVMNPISAVFVRRRIYPTIAEVRHRHHVVIGGRSIRPVRGFFPDARFSLIEYSVVAG